MRRRLHLLAAAALALTCTSRADVVYPPVVPGTALQFPRDEGSHPAFKVEWWYVTGWLRDGAGHERGFQVTFFRVRPGLAESNPSRFAPSQVLFAHAAIADPALGRLRHAERSARAGFGLAYAREDGMDVRLDDWSLHRSADGRYRARVRGDDFDVDLELGATQPPLLQGQDGYSRKGPDPRAASYYYSLPQLRVHGTLAIDGATRPVTGEAWFDHEWSSDYVDAGAQGWDWIGINLADGGALMAFRMRDPRGGQRWAAATLRTADGRVHVYAPGEIEWTPLERWTSPRTGTTYPVRWRLRLGTRSFELAPLMHDAELDSRSSTGTIYWEGPIRLQSTDGAAPALTGRGYLELTGYAGRLEL